MEGLNWQAKSVVFDFCKRLGILKPKETLWEIAEHIKFNKPPSNCSDKQFCQFLGIELVERDPLTRPLDIMKLRVDLAEDSGNYLHLSISEEEDAVIDLSDYPRLSEKKLFDFETVPFGSSPITEIKVQEDVPPAQANTLQDILCTFYALLISRHPSGYQFMKSKVFPLLDETENLTEFILNLVNKDWTGFEDALEIMAAYVRGKSKALTIQLDWKSLEPFLLRLDPNKMVRFFRYFERNNDAAMKRHLQSVDFPNATAEQLLFFAIFPFFTKRPWIVLTKDKGMVYFCSLLNRALDCSEANKNIKFIEEFYERCLEIAEIGGFEYSLALAKFLDSIRASLKKSFIITKSESRK
jgi:hypothetical protein